MTGNTQTNETVQVNDKLNTVETFETELAALPVPDFSAAGLRALTEGLAAHAGAADRAAELSRSGIELAHAAGMLTLPIGGIAAAAAAGRGGAGQGGSAVSAISAVDFARGFAALGEGDPSVALVALMTAVQHRVALSRRDWPADLHREILREAATRPILINAARAEPALGSAARGGQPETTMRRVGDRWILNGHKRFVTGAEHLDYHVVWALDPETGETGRLIVPGNATGVEAIPGDGMIGMRASSTHDVVYRDVEVPLDNLCLQSTQEGRAIAPEFELGVSALYVGIARAARETLVRFLATRAPSGLGTPLAQVDRIQLEVGSLTARLFEAESVLFSHARLIDEAAAESTEGSAGREGSDPDERASRIAATKYLCTNAAIDVVESAVRLGGGFALAEHGDLARHLRNVLCARPHPPQGDVALRALGSAALTR